MQETFSRATSSGVTVTSVIDGLAARNAFYSRAGAAPIPRVVARLLRDGLQTVVHSKRDRRDSAVPVAKDIGVALKVKKPIESRNFVQAGSTRYPPNRNQY